MGERYMPGPDGCEAEVYQFADDDLVEWMGLDAAGVADWQPVRVLSRTIVKTLAGTWVAAYRVEDRRGRQWVAGNGELRRR